MTTPKVLISDDLSEKAKEIFEVRGVDVDVKIGLSADELKKIIGNYDGLAIRSATKVKQDIIAEAKNLKVVGRAGIGVDNVDIDAATAKGVIVMNTPFGNSITTAEHAIAMMFALAREIPLANQSTKASKWEKSRFMGVELTNKVLGVVGCGNIGSIVAVRGLGLKMKVIAFDPFLSAERAEELGVEKVELDTLFTRADFITVHTPLNEKTKGIINKKTIATMKDGVRLINCARGGIIVEADLLEALKSGKVAGAALDVFEEEPAKGNPLFELDNVICTPHLGASTTEAQENVAVQVAEQMCDFLLDGAITNSINTPSLSAEDAKKLRPYMSLAIDIGSLVGQIAQTSFEQIEILYEGEISKLNCKPLTSLILTSLLAPSMASVNVVNAAVVAKERGIKITESVSNDATDYHTLLTIKLVTEKETYTVSGTIFGHNKARIVNVMNVPIESEVTQNMLFVQNNDKPGFIGALGSLLGSAGINIANFNLGRAKDGSGAVALLSIDQPLNKDVLEKAKALAHVIRVKELSFRK